MKRPRALYIAVPRWAVDAILDGVISDNVKRTLRELAKDADVLIDKRIARRNARKANDRLQQDAS